MSPGHRIEAGTLAAYLATTTDRIRLAPTLHVTTTEPFHLATQLASLDHATRGRAGWLVGAADSPDDLATVGAGPSTADDVRREVRDVIDVARDLWDSWEDDAVIRDVGTGRYLDPTRVHHVDFVGARFSVKGPLITPRPPQGHPILLAPDHLDLADRVDVVLVGGTDVDAVTARAVDARRAGAVLVFAELDLTFAEGDDHLATDRLRYRGATTLPSVLAESLSTLSRVVDGVRLRLGDPETDLRRFVGATLPAPDRAGLLHTPRSRATLRDTLGLLRPSNRFADRRAATTGPR